MHCLPEADCQLGLFQDGAGSGGGEHPLNKTVACSTGDILNVTFRGTPSTGYFWNLDTIKPGEFAMLFFFNLFEW